MVERHKKVQEFKEHWAELRYAVCYSWHCGGIAGGSVSDIPRFSVPGNAPLFLGFVCPLLAVSLSRGVAVLAVLVELFAELITLG